MSWVNTYLDEYYSWLKEKTLVQQSSNTDWFIINTPFIGAFNDTIEIYAQKNKDKLILSDNGDTIANLELQGLNIQGSNKRKELLDSILLNYGVRLKNDELFIETSLDNFPQIKHNFLSSILEINDLYVLSKHNVSSIFKEDVRDYLNSLDIIYTADFISKGVTGLEFNFDFQIANKENEIVIKSFNTISKANLPAFLFSWDDIKPVREKSSKKEVRAIAIINDQDKKIKEKYLEALRNKNADFILWSDRNKEEEIKKLKAA